MIPTRASYLIPSLSQVIGEKKQAHRLAVATLLEQPPKPAIPPTRTK